MDFVKHYKLFLPKCFPRGRLLEYCVKVTSCFCQSSSTERNFIVQQELIKHSICPRSVGNVFITYICMKEWIVGDQVIDIFSITQLILGMLWLQYICSEYNITDKFTNC